MLGENSLPLRPAAWLRVALHRHPRELTDHCASYSYGAHLLCRTMLVFGSPTD